VSEVAENLGICKDLLYRWRRQMNKQGEIAFPGNGKTALTQDQKRIRELEKKLKDVEMERDILKKAIRPARA
jgi:transposase-like protein